MQERETSERIFFFFFLLQATLRPHPQHMSQHINKNNPELFTEITKNFKQLKNMRESKLLTAQQKLVKSNNTH